MARLVNLACTTLIAACGFPDYRFVSADTSADAGAEVGASSFCASKSGVFCADFDRSTDVKAGWDEGVESRGDFSLTASTDQPMSPPRSLLARTGRPDAQGWPAGLLLTKWPTVATTTTEVEADVRVDTASTGSAGTHAGSPLLVRYGDQGAIFSVNSPGLEVEVDTIYSTQNARLAPSASLVLNLHEWIHVRMVLESTSSSSPGNVTLVVTKTGGGSVTLYDHVSLAAGGIDGKLAGQPELGVGSFYSSSDTDGWAFAIDNVVFSAK